MTRKNTPVPRKILVAVSPLLMLLCLVLIVTSTLEYRRLGKEETETRNTAYTVGTQEAADALGKTIAKVEEAAETLATALSDGSLLPADYEHSLADMIRRDPMFYGGAIAFAPYAFDPKRRLHAPYFARKDGGLELMYIEDAYDYTSADQEWFGKAMASGSRWSTPYFDKSLGDILMTTYSAVVYRQDDAGVRQPVAVVTIDVSIEALGDAVKAFGLGGAGFPEIVTDQGLYLYTPAKSRVLNRESLFASRQWIQDKNFDHLRDLIASRTPGLGTLHDASNGSFHWVSVAPVPASPWVILGNFADSEAVSHTPERRHLLMRIILGTVLLACIALFYRQAPPGPDAVISWYTSIFVTVSLLIGVLLVWHVSMEYASDHDRKTFPVTSEQAVARELRIYTSRATAHLTAPPIAIPTGIYIESMKFISNSDLQVVGTIWQKYDLQHQQHVARGVILPGAGRLQLSQPVVQRDGNTELLRWQFSGEWRFRHDFTRYPLLQDDFGLGLFPQDTADNILLLPDVDSYSYLAPTQLPGISPNVFLLGWGIVSSYFELRPWQHTTTFGRPVTLKDETLPELYFSVRMEKVFINSVISNLTPLAIAMTIAFILLLISTRDATQRDMLKTGVGFDIGICTSIFFVVVLSHIGLRNSIVSDEVFYLEYFYLLMYLNLIWVCCRSILSGLDHPVLQKWTFGISAKKAYFPANFAVIFAFTWLIFYQ